MTTHTNQQKHASGSYCRPYKEVTIMLPDNIKTIVDFTLGDGWIGYRSKTHKLPYMRIEHGQAQVFYAKHKQRILETLGYDLSARLYMSTTKRNHGRYYYQINTFQHKDFDTARKWTYNRNLKVVDKALLRNLDAKSLAYWFMDDGCAKLSNYNQNKDKSRKYFENYKTHCYKLSTNNFSYEEHTLILAWLKEKFDITAKIEKSMGSYCTLIFGTENKDRFRSTVEPYIIDDMRYKISHPHTFDGMSFEIVEREQTERENQEVLLDATVENTNDFSV